MHRMLKFSHRQAIVGAPLWLQNNNNFLIVRCRFLKLCSKSTSSVLWCSCLSTTAYSGRCSSSSGDLGSPQTIFDRRSTNTCAHTTGYDRKCLTVDMAALPAADSAAAAPAAVPGPLPCEAEQLMTKLLKVDVKSLPPVPHVRAAVVHDILTSHSVDLSPASQPHLYFSWCTGDNENGKQQHQHQPQNFQELGEASSSFAALQQAAELLRSGHPVAIPTETVYGLAANALSESAVKAVFEAKGRPSDNPLIVHVSDLRMLAQLFKQPQLPLNGASAPPSSNSRDSSSDRRYDEATDAAGQLTSSSSSDASLNLDFIPEQYRALIAAFWPGPLTLLLPATPLIPAVVTAGLPTVAVRMPAHPVARALIAAAGVPVAAPSANTSGRPSPTTAQHVMEDLGGRVVAVVDGGACQCGVESTVLDGLRHPPVVLRPGGITPEQLSACPDMKGLQVYQRDFKDPQLEAQPTTPGMKYRHYSPHAPLLLLDPTPAWQARQAQAGQQLEGAQQQAGGWLAAGQVSQEQQQQQVLQQLVVKASQQLLEDIKQQWQQHHQPHQQPQQPQQQLRVVLLSTCGNSGNTSIGWTSASKPALRGRQVAEQQQHGELQTAGAALRILHTHSHDTHPDEPHDIHGGSLLHPGNNNNNSTRTHPYDTLPSNSCQAASPGTAHSCGQDTPNGGSSSSSDSCGMEVLEYVLGDWQRPDLVAQQLFAGLRAADVLKPDYIVVQGLPPVGAALAVMNRLQKAACQQVPVMS